MQTDLILPIVIFIMKQHREVFVPTSLFLKSSPILY